MQIAYKVLLGQKFTKFSFDYNNKDNKNKNENNKNLLRLIDLYLLLLTYNAHFWQKTGLHVTLPDDPVAVATGLQI